MRYVTFNEGTGLTVAFSLRGTHRTRANVHGTYEGLEFSVALENYRDHPSERNGEKLVDWMPARVSFSDRMSPQAFWLIRTGKKETPRQRLAMIKLAVNEAANLYTSEVQLVLHELWLRLAREEAREKIAEQQRYLASLKDELHAVITTQAIDRETF